MPKIPCGMTILVNDKLETLVGFRIADQGWEFPGGKSESGEKILHTAIRELSEETGLYVNHLKYLGYYDEHPDYLIHVFGKRIGKTPRTGVLEPDKCREWKWVSYFSKAPLTKVGQDIVGMGFYEEVKQLPL